MKSKQNSVEKNEIISENVTIIYKNGMKKIFEAISTTEKGVFTGRLKTVENHHEFVNDSFIPQDQIEEIIVFNQHSRSKQVIFKNKEEGDEK